MEEYTVVMASSYGRTATMGHCVWEYNGTNWSLKKDESENGGIPSVPPQQPGRFKGQLRVTPCVAG